MCEDRPDKLSIKLDYQLDSFFVRLQYLSDIDCKVFSES